jgi:hypothetical protein
MTSFIDGGTGRREDICNLGDSGLRSLWRLIRCSLRIFFFSTLLDNYALLAANTIITDLFWLWYQLWVFCHFLLVFLSR